MKVNINGNRIDLDKIAIYRIMHREFHDETIKDWIEFSSKIGTYSKDIVFKSQAEAMLAYRWLLERENIQHHWLNGREYDL